MDTAWNTLIDAVNAARNDTSPKERVTHLRKVRDTADSLLNEALAELVVYSGVSIRSAASQAGFTDNAVRPRLAQTSILAGYAENGEMSISGIHRARHDYAANPQQKREPMRFVPRNPTTGTTKGRKDND